MKQWCGTHGVTENKVHVIIFPVNGCWIYWEFSVHISAYIYWHYRFIDLCKIGTQCS